MYKKIIVPPAIEPVTLLEAKTHARIDNDNEDTILESYIIAARQLCENYCNRQFIFQTILATFDEKNLSQSYRYNTLEIRSGINQINSVKYYDSSDNEYNLQPSDYTQSDYRIYFQKTFFGSGEPRSYDAYVVEYVAGFGETAQDVPQAIRVAVLQTFAHFYENRQALIDPISVKNATANQQIMLPFGVTALLQPYRIFE